MLCNKVFGEKEPLEDKSITTGICPDCWPGEETRLKKLIEKRQQQQTQKDPTS
jgi:predicted DsbA family dithiol-disulfide isomerase